MTWVRRTDPTPPPAHACDPPMRPFAPAHDLNAFTAVSDGRHGDLWRCDECGRLWRNDAGSWERATWWQRRRYRRHGWPEAVTGPPRRDPPSTGGQYVVSTAMVPPPADAPPAPPVSR